MKNLLSIFSWIGGLMAFWVSMIHFRKNESILGVFYLTVAVYLVLTGSEKLVSKYAKLALLLVIVITLIVYILINKSDIFNISALN